MLIPLPVLPKTAGVEATAACGDGRKTDWDQAERLRSVSVGRLLLRVAVSAIMTRWVFIAAALCATACLSDSTGDPQVADVGNDLDATPAADDAAIALDAIASFTDAEPIADAAPPPDAGFADDASPEDASMPEPLSVLLFSRTAAFRHGSIPAAIAALESVGETEGWSVTATEDAAQFTDQGLAGFDVVVFLLTSGDILNNEQQGALERFVRAGGGWVGVHSASDTEYDWPWYGGLVGAYFRNHPSQQNAEVRVVNTEHPATRGLPTVWQRFDEWYNFRTDPSDSVDVLAVLDETTYEGGTMGESHPIAWSHEYDGGRAFYTAGGHRRQNYEEPEFVAHIRGGIEWAAGR